MFSLKLVLHIFVYVVVVCPLLQVQCHIRGRSGDGNYIENGDHIHTTERPCAVCPHGGSCVPKIQCPERLRPGSSNPLCHIDEKGTIGVCCSMAHRHASETERKKRSSTISVEDMKASHGISRQKVAEWYRTAKKVGEGSDIVLNISSPSYGHHLSMVTYDGRVKELGRGALLNLFAAQELKSRQVLDSNDLELGLTEHTDGPFCPPRPSCPARASRYRTLNGECNNLRNPSWGAANTAFEKLLPPDHSDGLWAMRASISGHPLPSARTVSHRLLMDGSRPSPTHNMMFMQFGQFVTHDISAGAVFTTGDGKPISCCTGDGEDIVPIDKRHPACASIMVEPNDPFYGHFNQRCMNFVRTQLAAAPDCSVGYAKQMNGATHFPDLSHLYGSTSDKLETLIAPGGLLKVFKDYGRDLPPTTDRNECLTAKGTLCFDSGDHRGNQLISLTAMHTIWTREHNRVAKVLSRLNPKWSEDIVFQETRKILQGEFQHIIYNEWLPLLLGPQIVQLFKLYPANGYSRDYDPLINPSLTSEFSCAAMRFGHSVVDGKIIVPNPRNGEINEAISIPEVMFQPSRLRLLPFLDRLLVGVSTQPMQSVDPFVTEGLTRYMFRGGNPYGLDLAAINLQRGRDHGLRPYNHYRRLCGLQPLTDFRQYSPMASQRLSSVYSSPEDIELWVGGLLEAPVKGGIVGETFAQIIADQFARLKKGDRYYYEYGPDINPGPFTPSQLAEIKKVTLARILCDNRDGIEYVAQSPSAFLRADFHGYACFLTMFSFTVQQLKLLTGTISLVPAPKFEVRFTWGKQRRNEPVPCDSPLIPSMDLGKFREV